MLCHDLEQWDGEMGGRLKREPICIHIANILHCTEDTNTTLQSNYTAIKKVGFFLFKRMKSKTFIKQYENIDHLNTTSLHSSQKCWITDNQYLL